MGFVRLFQAACGGAVRAAGVVVVGLLLAQGGRLVMPAEAAPLEAVLTAQVSDSGEALAAADTFPADGDAVFLALTATSGAPVSGQAAWIAVAAEGLAPETLLRRSKIAVAGGSAQVLELKVPSTGLPPGDYRVDLDFADGSSSTLPFTVGPAGGQAAAAPQPLEIPDAQGDTPDKSPEAAEAPEAPAKSEVARASKAGIELVVRNLSWADAIDGTSAAPGRRFLRFDLELINRSGIRASVAAVAEFAQMVEDGQFTYRSDPLTGASGSPLAQEAMLEPGQSLAGLLIYQLPEDTGHLALMHFGPEGVLKLPLTPERAAVALPAAAGPAQAIALGGGDAKLLVTILAPEAAKPPSAPEGQRLVIADFALEIESSNPLATLPLEPAALVVLRDGQDRSYAPVDPEPPLARPFGTIELWVGQVSRGQLAFLVPAGDDGPKALDLEVAGRVSLPLPFEPAAQVAAAAPEKQPLSLEPAAPEKQPLSLDPGPDEPAQPDETSQPDPDPAALACTLPAADEGTRAVFLGEDRVTQGIWQGVYGRDGQILVSYVDTGQDQSRLPAFIESYAFSGGTEYWTWDRGKADPRVLEPLEGGFVASTAYQAGSISLTLEAKDDQPHVLTLYFLDFDRLERTQQVSIHDALTDELLSERNLASYGDGVYFVYEVQGSVRLEVTNTGPHNALLGGVFWDSVSPRSEAELLAAIEAVGDGTRSESSIWVQRGEEIRLFSLRPGDPDGGSSNEAPAAGDLGSPGRPGLTARYLTGPGYGQLIEEREDPGIAFSWWQDETPGFPDQDRYQAEDLLWAEWEGELVVPDVPDWKDPGEILVPQGPSTGISLTSTAAGLCVTAVEANGPAELGGLEAGDVILALTDLRAGPSRDIVFRMDAPEGGHLFVDGVRLLAHVPCGLPGMTECKHGPRLEASSSLPAGAHQLRIAAVRQGSRPGAEPPAEAPAGPLLSWRFLEEADFKPISTEALRAVPRPGAWSRTPRQAAQIGLEWLQSAAVDWQKSQNCFGCHVQSQAVMGMAIAQDNEYQISGAVYDELLTGMASFQREDGVWHDSHPATAAQFGAMAFAEAQDRGNDEHNVAFLRAVRLLLGAQQDDGRVPLDHEGWPIDQGDILVTANSRRAFSVAAGVAPDGETAAIRDGEQRALQWLVTAEPSTNQDRAMRILGLATDNPDDRKPLRQVLSDARTDLLAHQLADGAWEESDGKGSNAFATGQALYALRVAGQSIASAPFQRGVDWLLDQQLWTGAWPPINTHSGERTQFAPTMWPVIALVGSFQAVGVEIVEPIADSCLQGEVELAARVVTDDPIELVRFLVDGEVVGKSLEAEKGGFHRISWDADKLPAGSHDIRIEALWEGAVRGEDQTQVFTAAKGDGCAGTLNLASLGEPIAGIAAPNIELVFDASGSMRERKRKINGRLKIDVAKDVMAEIIRDLPDGINVGLRVYGQRVREGRAGDCQDSELVSGFSTLDKPGLLAQVQNIRALGTTPIAYSLVQAAKDLAAAPGGKLIVLVTDGKEECGASPQDVAAKLVELGMTLRVDVVGFALAEEAVKRDMEQVAEYTGGRFFDAQDAEALREGIKDALAASYDVLDKTGARVASGVLDHGAIKVPRGVYDVAINTVVGVMTVPDVAIGYQEFTKVELTKSGEKVTAEILGPVTKDEADWAEGLVPAAWTPPASEPAEDPAQLARLNQGLEELEEALGKVKGGAVAGSDPNVRDAQQKLTQLGFRPGPVDGAWGRKTEQALRSFQRWYPLGQLEATGVLDDPTVQALAEAVAGGLKVAVAPAEPAPAEPAPASRFDMIGEIMDDFDRALMVSLFEEGVSGQASRSWTNPGSGNQFEVTANPAYQSTGTQCRDATVRVDSAGERLTSAVTACERGGRWVYR